MKSDGKEETLGKFRIGELHILLATQVIEICVHVPDASMMIVMNSKRFGMTQLHQLMGWMRNKAAKMYINSINDYHWP
jgi:ATP-dependent DNA helicase RecG